MSYEFMSLEFMSYEFYYFLIFYFSNFIELGFDSLLDGLEDDEEDGYDK